MICRFYSYPFEAVSKLTIKEFMVLSENISKICELENPDMEKEEAKPLSSMALKGIKKKPNKNIKKGKR